jgi:DUF4097 and DUF4098 domain-containing protein YvlB
MKIKTIGTLAIIIMALAFTGAPALSADNPELRPAARSATRIIIRNSDQKSKYVETRTLTGKIETGAGKALAIDTSEAQVTVTGWSGNEVVVEAKIEVGSDNPEVVRESLEATELLVEPEGGGGRIRLRSPFDEDPKDRSKGLSEALRKYFRQRRINFSYSAWLDIKVPESQSLDIKNAFGDVTVKGVTGRHELKNESGEVKVETCGGAMRLENSFANVLITDFKGEVDVRNESGEVNIKGITGRADVRNSFNRVTFERVGGDLTVKSESGSVRGTDVGGFCRIESSFEEVDVRNVTGNLDIKGESLEVTAAAVKGNVTIESSFAPVKVTNIGGALRITAESSAIAVDEIGRDALLRTSFAKIEASRVHGPVTVDCESGPVSLREVDGDAVITSSFGDVSATMVKGSLDVKSESSKVSATDIGRAVSITSSFETIEVRRCGGDVKIKAESSPVLVEDPGGAVDVSNSFGYVILRGTRGSVLVRSESSSVELSAIKSLPLGSVVDIRTSFNPITVTFPAGVEPKIMVRTEFGRVRSDFPVYIVDTGLGEVSIESRDQKFPQTKQDRFEADKNAVVVRLETSSADVVIKR